MAPMHRVVVPLKSSVPAQAARQCGDESVEAGNNVKKDPLEEFGERLAKRGFVVENIGSQQIIAELSIQHELRDLALRPETAGASRSVSPTDQLAQASQTRYVGRNFFRLWSPTLFHQERDKFNRRQKVFEGTEAQMDLILSALVPTTLPVRPGHISVDQYSLLSMEVLRSGIGRREAQNDAGEYFVEEWVQDVIAFYLSVSMEVPPSEKLKLASQTGNELLLISTLHNQCGKVEAIEEIVENQQVYDEISEGPKANLVMKKMLQHQTKCGTLGYAEELKTCFTDLVTEMKERFKDSIDFSESTWLEKWAGERSTLSSVCLSVGDNRLYASRWALASWSPVFYRMLYGDFAEGSAHASAIPLDDEICEGGSGTGSVSLLGALRFLNLLHPTRMWALWYLLPSEVNLWHPDPVLADIFEILFDKNLELLMEVFQLAHKFQIESLVEFCVLMVEVNSDFGLAERILLADSYHLPQMMARCLSKMTTARGVKRTLQERPGFLDDLSCPAHKLIAERLLDLV